MSQHCYFLNENIGVTLSGIEKSSMLRAKLFVEELGIVPTFVTVTYNRDLSWAWQRYVNNGDVPDVVPIINLFDYYQRTELGKERPTYQLEREPFQVIEPVTNGDVTSYKVTDDISNDVKWVMYDRNGISYINHIVDGAKIKQDVFNRTGQLSSTKYFKDKTVVATDYYDVEGRIVLRQIEDDVWQLYNHYGIETHLFRNKGELIGHFVNTLLARQKDTEAQPILFIDKNLIYKDALLALKRSTAKLVPMIHAAHYSDPVKLNQSKVNYNYTHIFMMPYLFDAIVVPTASQGQDIHARFGLKNVSPIPHPSDMVEAIPPHTPSDQFRIVSMSRLSKEKQLPLMVEVFAKIKAALPNAILDIYGSGGERAAILEAIKQHQLEDSVTLKGYALSTNKIYQAADLMLTTSQTESFSLSILESLANGCPVACFDVKYGPHELVQAGVNGIKAAPFDSESLASQIIDYAKQPDQAQLYRTNAVTSAQAYSFPNVAKKWAQLLEDL
jgi:glycosyltransferase involved in cell wall biosynthesis